MMAKFEIIRMGDERGIGSIVQRRGLFGRKSTWTVKPSRDARCKDDWFLDEWICREDTRTVYRDDTPLDAFYTAQYALQCGKA